MFKELRSDPKKVTGELAKDLHKVAVGGDSSRPSTQQT